MFQDVEIGNLLEKEFRVMIIKIQELRKRMNAQRSYSKHKELEK